MERDRIRRHLAAVAIGAALALALADCSLPRCSGGSTCTCDGAGDCNMFCDGAGCNFDCNVAGDCHFDCPQGHCTVKAENAGNVYLSCEVGYCAMDCQNAGTCYLTYCPTGCTCGQDGMNDCITSPGVSLLDGGTE